MLLYQLIIRRDHGHGGWLHVLVLIGRAARVYLGRSERLLLARSDSGLLREGVLDVNLGETGPYLRLILVPGALERVVLMFIPIRHYQLVKDLFCPEVRRRIGVWSL